MSEKRAELADRIRALMAAEPNCEEKRLFGTLAFMVNDKLLAAARGGGDLLLRVDPERSAELQLRDGVTEAEMGPSRKKMGPSWLDVAAEVITDDEQLLFWIDVAREYNTATR